MLELTAGEGELNGVSSVIVEKTFSKHSILDWCVICIIDRLDDIMSPLQIIDSHLAVREIIIETKIFF